MLKSMIWNVRGANRTFRHTEIRKALTDFGVSMCALVETKVHISRIGRVCNKIKSDWQWHSNARVCKGGTRIAIGWDPGVWDLNVIHDFDQVVHCKVVTRTTQHSFFVSFVYASNDYRERRVLWNHMRLHHAFVKDDPWLVSGDFNVCLKANESTS